MKFEMVPCPHCGEEIKSTAKACRYCGSDEKTGWSTVSYPEGVDFPDEEEREEDYADSLDREGFSSGETFRQGSVEKFDARNGKNSRNFRKGFSIKNLSLGVIALALILVFLFNRF